MNGLSHRQEAEITIGGIPLTEAQSCTIRNCINSFLTQLSDPEFCADLGEIARRGKQSRGLTTTTRTALSDMTARLIWLR